MKSTGGRFRDRNNRIKYIQGILDAPARRPAMSAGITGSRDKSGIANSPYRFVCIEKALQSKISREIILIFVSPFASI